MTPAGIAPRVIRPDPRDDDLTALLAPWLPSRRWFPLKGTDFLVEALGGTTLPTTPGAQEVRIVLLRARSAQDEAVLQVPLILYSVDQAPAIGGVDDTPGDLAPDPSVDNAVIGRLPDGTAVLDASAATEFLRAWLTVADCDATTKITPESLGTPRPVAGEQSNTSVVLPGVAPGGGTGVLKIFRSLSDGQNPEVDVPRALAGADWPHVPRPLAWLSAQWPDNVRTAHGHLGVLSTFVPDAADGFELACVMARRGESFGPLARELGEVIAQLHIILSTILPITSDPTEPSQSQNQARAPSGTNLSALAVADSLSRRFAWARAAVPSLATHADAIQALTGEVTGLTGLPPNQRVHGDLHLGQVLRGEIWYVLDFEGEPLRTIAERTVPDLALRDVAGMLRSFDYAAAVGRAPEMWANTARNAFWTGYTAQSPDLDSTLSDTLLRCLELDKALYEAVYEARNRPVWQEIPLRAITRLLT